MKKWRGHAFLESFKRIKEERNVAWTKGFDKDKFTTRNYQGNIKFLWTKSCHEEKYCMQRKTTKKRHRNMFRQNPTDRLQPATGSAGNMPKIDHPIGWWETDRMGLSEVTSFAVIGQFTPHNHVWLIISAY